MKKSILIVIFGVLMFGGLRPTLAVIPNDVEFGRQRTMWENINVPTAWDIATGSKRVVVAVIDTGVDTWHPDLVDNIWVNEFEIEGNSFDDDHNGYIDDSHGWNFIENSNDVRTSVFNKEDLPEAVRHGTVAAGLIGATGNNLLGGAGINWQVSIMPLRAVRSDGYGSMSDVTNAIRYAVDNGADVISMSMVSVVADEGLRLALRLAYEQGVAVVAAAGNRHADLAVKPHYPICYDSDSVDNWIIGVGALSSSTPDKLAYFSDYGKCLDLLAPGTGINSTERYAPQYGYDKMFGGPWDGTSFAAPIVAGAVALIKSIHPEWTPAKIISVLQSTADNVDSANSNLTGKLGAGRLNIGKAVARVAMETSFRGVDLSRLFYVYEKNKIARLNVGTGGSYILANVNDAEIIDLARMGNRSGGREYLAVLLRRDKFTYIKFYDENGRNLKEVGLEGASDRKAIPTKISWRGENLIVGYKNNSAKLTYLVDYDFSGVKLREFKVKNLIDWESEPRTGYLALIVPEKSAFKWELYNDKNKINSFGWWRGYQAVDEIRVGYFWGEMTLQISAVLKTAKKTEWKLVDSQSKITTTEILPQKKSNYTIIPGILLARPAFFVYAPGEKGYRFYNGRADLLSGGEF